MTSNNKLLKLAALKRVESAGGVARYKKSIGSVITGNEATQVPAGKSGAAALPENGGLTGAAAVEYQEVLKNVRSALSSGNYDIGIKKLRSAIQMLRKTGGDERTALVLQRALIRLERTVASSVRK